MVSYPITADSNKFQEKELLHLGGYRIRRLIGRNPNLLRVGGLKNVLLNDCKSARRGKPEMKQKIKMEPLL